MRRPAGVGQASRTSQQLLGPALRVAAGLPVLAGEEAGVVARELHRLDAEQCRHRLPAAAGQLLARLGAVRVHQPVAERRAAPRRRPRLVAGGHVAHQRVRSGRRRPRPTCRTSRGRERAARGTRRCSTPSYITRAMNFAIAGPLPWVAVGLLHVAQDRQATSLSGRYAAVGGLVRHGAVDVLGVRRGQGEQVHRATARAHAVHRADAQRLDHPVQVRRRAAPAGSRRCPVGLRAVPRGS